jgi:hypothetical protein
MPHIADAASAKSRAVPSSCTSVILGVPAGAIATSTRSRHAATATPSAPPASEMSVLFDEQLVGEPQTAAAERRADRQLVLAAGAARNQ